MLLLLISVAIFCSVANLRVGAPEATAARSLVQLPPRQDFRAEGSIPKIIHQTWKSKELPVWARRPVKSWKEKNPGWTHILYDDDDMERIVEEHYPQILPYYREMKPIQKADVFRYVIIFAKGGVYADLDVSCLVSIDDWSRSVGVYDKRAVDLIIGFESVQTKKGWEKYFAAEFQLCQWVFAGAKHHWAFDAVLREIITYFQRGENAKSKSVIKSTGPGIWSLALQKEFRARYGVTFGREPLTHARLKQYGLKVESTLILKKRAFGERTLSSHKVESLVSHGFQGTWKKGYNALRPRTPWRSSSYRKRYGRSLIRPDIPQECRHDRTRFCANVTKGKGRTHGCLVSHNSSLTLSCRNALQKSLDDHHDAFHPEDRGSRRSESQRKLRKGARPGVPKECEEDRRQYCRHVKPGNGRTHACLRVNASLPCRSILKA